jgi:glutamate dehydrogenase/leucine dehydrogenase
MNPHKLGLTLAAFIGGWHVVWSVLVLTGWAQAVVDYRGATRAVAFATLEEKIRDNTRAVLETARTAKITPRRAAVDLASGRVRTAMSSRRFSIF